MAKDLFSTDPYKDELTVDLYPTEKQYGSNKLNLGNVNKWSQPISAFNKLSQANGDPKQNAMRNAGYSALSSFGPIGMAISAGAQLVDGIGLVTGHSIDNIDTNAAKAAGIKGAGFSNFIGGLPGMALFAGKSTKSVNDLGLSAQKVASSYGGLMKDKNTADALSGKQFSIFNRKSRKQADNYISDVNDMLKTAESIGYNATKAKQATSDHLQQQNFNTYQGFNKQNGLQLAKKGIKLASVDEIRKMKRADKNVIPDGAFHSRKHNLNEISEDFKDLTPKGIPVVLEEEGSLIQTAEIEIAELILTKAVTEKLEELYKDGSEESMIEAGKLLTNEILFNTDDKTNKLL